MTTLLGLNGERTIDLMNQLKKQTIDEQHFLKSGI